MYTYCLWRYVVAPTVKKGPTRSVRLSEDLDKRLTVWMKKNHLDLSATLNLAISKLLENEVILSPVFASNEDVESFLDDEIKAHRDELDKLK